MTTADKLQAILNSKNAIKNAINTKGGNVGDVLSTYADAITNLPSGGGESELSDYSKYTFIDYDGTLLYSYTDEELDALEELPAGPDHTDDNLTFQEWNWSLEDLKAWDRTRPDRPSVGANLITTDGKSYLYLDTPYTGATLSFDKSGKLNSVDWGDGTIDTNTSHIYANPGQYVIVIDMAEGGYWYFGFGTASTTTNKQWIKKIKLGNANSVKQPYAFYYCYSLQTISIPNGVPSIERIDIAAFNFCYSLKNISIPNGVTSIRQNTFNNCVTIKNISIPNGLTSIGDSAFNGCSAMQNISIPDSVTSVVSNTFNGCYNLQNIFIPNGLTSIGNSMFNGCYNLQNISIPDNITSIGDYEFSDCHSLQTISIPDGVISIGNSAFNKCHSLQNISIPNGVTSIGNNAFYSCYNLQNISIPNGVTSIENSTFYSCYNLQNISIPDNITSIGSGAFSNCYTLTLDLSEQTKVITLSSSIGLNTKYNKILVPNSLLADYKAAQYWSSYASIMVGV